jgi:hypothetical protein
MKPDLGSIIDLLHRCAYASLATNAREMAGYPFLSVLPVALDEQHCPVLLISDLAEHTRNLQADARASLLLFDPGASDLQAGARLTLIGEIRPFVADPALIERYLRYQPTAERLLALGDFHFLRMRLQRLRFIGGFARMGWLDADAFELLSPVSPPAEQALLAELAASVSAPLELLGLDRWGIDCNVRGVRHRVSLASAPVGDETLADALASALREAVAAEGQTRASAGEAATPR